MSKRLVVETNLGFLRDRNNKIDFVQAEMVATKFTVDEAMEYNKNMFDRLNEIVGFENAK